MGYSPDHPARAVARLSVEKLLVIHEDEAYCQPCVSPVWDTALAAHAMLEAGGAANEARAQAGLDWLKPLQILDVKGDWAEARPDVRPGGWAFQYNNAHYPDLDDTAVVVMAMDRAGVADRMPIDRGVEWTVGLQSKNGGWGAFDADNGYDYLNNLPFADHGALLDPPTADVSARCVSMLAQLGEGQDSPRMAAALAYLRKEQEPEGSWFGRWGVNYIYGTWSVLCALNAAGIGPGDPMVARAVEWLKAIQNPDGGWGEDCESYALDRKSHLPASSTASQTAWALLGLMAAGEVESEAGRARHKLARGASGGGRPVGAGDVHGRRFPARLLSALSRLSQIFPAVGAGPLPQPPALEFAARHGRHMTDPDARWIVACGLKREAQLIARAQAGLRIVAGGGDGARLERELEDHARRHRAPDPVQWSGRGARSLATRRRRRHRRGKQHWSHACAMSCRTP